MSSESSNPAPSQCFSNLWAWLHTWEDLKGGIHGPVVYHHRDNLRVLRPDTWTQGAAILGLLQANRTSNDQSLLDAATRLGLFLVENYIPEMHIYRDSNFDQKPLGSPALEGNSLASLALVELSSSLGAAGSRFRDLALDNLSEYVVRQWDPQRSCFEVKYHGGRAHIHNKSAMAILSILASEGYKSGGEATTKYAIPSAEYILASQVTKGELRGAFPYADTDTNYRTLYSLVTGLGMLGLHRATGESKYIESVEMLLSNLSRFIDRKTGLICHFHREGYPQWVTDTILFELVSKMADDQRNKRGEERRSSLSRVLSYQYPSGAFPLSLGFADLWYSDVMRSRPEIRRWRDVLPTPGMNAWNLWFLSSFLERGEKVPPPDTTASFTTPSDREEREGPYEVIDSSDRLVVRTRPDGDIRLLISKHDDVPEVCGLSERTSYWKTIDSIMRYPAPLRRLILAAPRIWLKLRR